VKYVIFIAAALGAVMLFLLATAGDDTGLFDRKYRLLIRLNVGFLLFLMAVVGYLLWRLRRRLKAGIFGSRLALRLLLIFSLMAVLPGALVYGISVQFLGKSIESWFDVKVDRALEGGLNLGRNILDNLLEELRGKAQAAALALSEQPDSPLPTLDRLVRQSQVEEATLFNHNGEVVAFLRADGTKADPETLSVAVMRQVKAEKWYSAVEPIPDKGLYLKVAVSTGVADMEGDTEILRLLQLVPKQLGDDAEIVQAAYRDYQELLLSREGLKSLYGVTLTLALLLSLFSALAAAFLISERLSAPLGMLAEGTRAVAQGDFSRRHPVQSRDELGVLTESFNLMTQQLEEARNTAHHHQQEVESARAYLENVLSNLSSGVLVFDEDLRMRTANLSAGQILNVSLSGLEGLTIEECAAREPQLGSFKTQILEGFRSGKKGEWQCQLERTRDGANQVLLLRGTRLPVSGGGGVVVFDDVTSLLQAQRTAAWGEVARRLAHEIKNPLTPIQLSAERMQHKLARKLNDDDAQILRRSTETIVNQVEAVEKMVNEFREYARAPELEFHLLDFNGLVREVLALYEAASAAASGNSQPHIYSALAPDLPMVRGDSIRLRQVIHNLLQNALDTLTGVAEPAIRVRTEIVPEGVRFSVSDNGGGFPEQVRARAFEPYVTTKSRGTGLGLPIVKKIIEEHSGMIQIENIRPHGARISLILPIAGKHNLRAYRTAI
jgi:nitrogen fixation/metabolism regulation signal transduction histidine kinase